MTEELARIDDLGLSEEELFSFHDNSSIESEKITAPRYSYWKSVFRVFFKKKINIIILTLLLLVIGLAYIYPMIHPYDQMEHFQQYDYYHMRLRASFETFGFSIRWIFGTGAYGESIWDAIWHGARMSLSLAFVCATINMTIGVVLGAIWGFSKTVDVIMTEVFNILGNVPYILLIGVFVMILSASFWTMVFALTITGWLGIAYFIRTQVIIIRDREYNLASKCLGTSTLRISVRNILPFMTSIIVTLLATELPSYISWEVFLAYIGMGYSPDSLGFLINATEQYMTTPGQEIEVWAPVFITSIITIVLYIVGQNLGDASDPRTHM